MENNFIAPWLERYRVRIGFAVGLLFVWRAQPRNIFFLLLGLLVSLVGILIRQWAAGTVNKNDELATQGPYAWVRHPLYFGSFLAAAGLVLASTSFALAPSKPYMDRSLFFWCALWILIDSIYLPKIAKEENFLREKFGQAYEEYTASVPRLFPRRFDPALFDFKSFSAERWKKNKEIWSLAGYACIAALLVMRYFIR